MHMTIQKVAIYGDSFAEPHGHGHWYYPELEQCSWINLLGKKYDVTSFGKGSTSVYYSYDKFLSSYEKYDKIIFLVTDEFRWVTTTRINNEEKHINSLGSIDLILDQYEPNQEELESLQFLKHYYLNITFEPSFSKFSHTIINLMLGDVIQKCQQKGIQLLLIANKSEPWRTSTLGKTSTSDYYQLFWKNYFKTTQELFANFVEKRTICHMSDIINEMFANDVSVALETGVWDPVLPNIVKHDQPIEYYFDRIADLKKKL